MRNNESSVKEMWSKYLASINEDEDNTKLTYTAWYFGHTNELSDRLAELVLKGEKRATTSLHYLYGVENEDLPKAGELSIITSLEGVAKCIIKTTNVKVMPFSEVNEDFAYREGEGDKSLEYWREVHDEVFNIYLSELNIKFSHDMLVVCEEFEVIYPMNEFAKF